MHWINFKAQTIFENGIAISMPGVCTDITTRKENEDALYLSESNYSAMVNQVIAGIMKTDLDGHIIFCNEQMASMLGYSVEEMLQKNKLDIVYEKDLEKNKALFAKLIQEGKSYILEKRVVRKDGFYIWVNNHASAIFDKAGHVQSTVIVSVDITQQKTIEKQKNDFISIASHELKTPLTSIKAYGELLQEIFDGNNKSDYELITKLNGQVKRLIKLVYGLLDTSRISEGKLLLRREQVDLNKLIDECVDEMRLIPSDHHIVVESVEVPTLFVDKDRIRQVIVNMISNAFKYSPDDTEIIISCKNQDETVEVKVRDFGSGIKPEDQKNIFKRFYQSGKNSNPASLGLGLYISMEIIKLHGGSIGLVSPPDSKGGSEFYFNLPCNKSL